jgi:hypothetical protein
MAGAGECYLINGYVKPHLHVVLLDYDQYSGTTVIVNIETFDSPKQDGTTVLQSGDHPFIDHPSYVNYRRGRTAGKSDIERWVKQGVAIPMDAMPVATLERIRQGMTLSPRANPDAKRYYENKRLDSIFAKK